MKSKPADGDKALAASTCECKDKFFGTDCSIDCSDAAKYLGTGINADKKCLCKAETFYDKGASVCAGTCDKVANTKVNTAKTGCDCDAGYIGSGTTECKKCDDTKASMLCICNATHTGDDCSKKLADANGFI